MRRKILYNYQIGKSNGKRRAVKAECDWEACGPIIRRSRIAETVEAAMLPRSEKDMS